MKIYNANRVLCILHIPIDKVGILVYDGIA